MILFLNQVTFFCLYEALGLTSSHDQSVLKKKFLTGEMYNRESLYFYFGTLTWRSFSLAVTLPAWSMHLWIGLLRLLWLLLPGILRSHIHIVLAVFGRKVMEPPVRNWWPAILNSVDFLKCIYLIINIVINVNILQQLRLQGPWPVT
jgi:hypothetical protein